MRHVDNIVKDWDLVIEPTRGWFDIRLKEVWKYRELILHFFKRDFVTFYKQTILGPLWYIIQPLLTTVVFTVIFGRLARVSTDGTPPFLFYLSGTVAWGYFAGCMTDISDTFIKNANLFEKVYFPRLTVSLAMVLTNLLKFGIQFLVFLGFYGFFVIKGMPVKSNLYTLLLPVLVLQMAILGLSTGLIISSMTAKYRDLKFLLSFGVQLWMYATPVVYPVSTVPEKYRMFYMLNPMASVIEPFRYAFLGIGTIHWFYILQGWLITLLLLFFGLTLFNRTDKTFMDTI